MLLTSITTVLSLIAASAGASVKPAPAMRVHEQRPHAPAGFVAVGEPHSDTPLRIRLGLKQRNVEGLIDALYRVSEPAGADYGKYLSKDEVAAFMAPADDTLSAVTEWLVENGITATPISHAGEWLEFTVPVSKANALFNAEFKTFKHTDSGTHGIRTLKYSVPAVLQTKIEAMLPGISFWTPSKVPKFTEVTVANTTRRGAAEKRQIVPCNQFITPPCLQQLYGIPTTGATQPSNTLAVSGFLDQYVNLEDLAGFLNTVRPDLAGNSVTIVLLDGGSNSQDPSQAGIEANLDVQYTVGIASDVPVTFVSVGENTQDGDLEGFLDIINLLSGLSQPPYVLTTSYGANEAFASPSVANMLCNAYASFGAQGASLIFSSGDGGVSGSQSTTFCGKFIPTFPSNCPFVTSVGATTGVAPESAADFSSGGFSEIFERPSYQDAAVSGYAGQIGDLYAGLYNAQGRAFPDVSLAGQNYVIGYQGNLVGPVDGTSASAPVFASIIALINDRRIAAGQPPLGFLNPFLYANPQVFTDITAGSNPGCGTNGFPALSGWDPVTGLGTPNFAALAAAAGVPV